jgi:MYXO-CTERM domain-containing protein
MRSPGLRAVPWLPLALLAACGPLGEGSSELVGTAVEASTTVCPATTVEGLDISAGQGTVDWSMVKASGRQFAIIKATQGDYYTSDQWADQWSGAKAAGLMRSPYHFFDPTVDGVTQAKYFLGVVGALGPGDLPPMLDIECPTSSDESQTQTDCEYGGASPDSGWATASVINQGIQDWLDYVSQQTGRTPLIYSYNDWFASSGADSTTLHGYPLVISWPTTTSCYEVGIGNDFTSAAFWQWSVTGSCPGVTGEVDLDRYNGTLAQLQQLAGYGSLSQVSGNDAMTLVSWPSDGHPEIFVQTKAGEMEHTYPNGATDTWSTTMYPLDKSSTCGAAAGFWSTLGYAELFDPAKDGSVQHLWFDLTTGWNTWQPDLAGKASTTFSHLSTLVWLDGHMEVFALGADHAIWHTHWNQSTDATWAPWASLGGDVVTGAAPILWSDGHAEIFATDAAGAAWHSGSGSGAGFPGGWSSFASLGGDLASRPVPVRWADGHLEVFASGSDGQLHHAAYGSSGWDAFTVLSPGFLIAGEPSAMVNPAGNGGSTGPEVFARTHDGKVAHLTWNGTSWTSFSLHFDQATASDPFAWIREDGTAEVFTIDDGGVLTRSYHDPMNGWAAWAPIGGTNLDPCLPPAKPATDGGLGGSSAAGSGSGGSESGGSVHAHAGCSCRVGERGEAPAGAVALGIAGVLAARRRRRRGCAGSPRGYGKCSART